MSALRVGDIYIATHTPTGKRYIGQTRGLIRSRWGDHWRKGKSYRGKGIPGRKLLPLYRLIRTTKASDWQVRPLMSGVPVDMLHEAEQSAIHLWRPELNTQTYFRPEWGDASDTQSSILYHLCDLRYLHDAPFQRKLQA